METTAPDTSASPEVHSTRKTRSCPLFPLLSVTRMPSKFGNARAQSDPRGEIDDAPAVRRAIRPSCEQLIRQGLSESGISRTVNIEYRIRIYVVASDEETSIQRHREIVIHRGGRLSILRR